MAAAYKQLSDGLQPTSDVTLAMHLLLLAYCYY